MVVHFEGGGKLQLMAEHIFLRDDEKKNLVCFGIANSTGNVLAPDGVGYYGNNLQGNFLIGFDLDTKLVLFKPTNCIKMTSTSSGGLLHPFSIFSTCLLYLLINWSF